MAPDLESPSLAMSHCGWDAFVRFQIEQKCKVITRRLSVRPDIVLISMGGFCFREEVTLETDGAAYDVVRLVGSASRQAWYLQRKKSSNTAET